MDDGKELTDIDRALADALDVDVSADFLARVRRRIASEPARAPFRRGWRIALPAAAAALVAIGLGIEMMSTNSPAASQPPTAPDRYRAAPVPAAVVRPEPMPAAQQPARRSALAARLSQASPREPEALVPREQIEMYRRLIAAAQQIPPAIVVEPQRMADLDGVVPAIEIDPIRIELIAPAAGAQGDRQ